MGIIKTIKMFAWEEGFEIGIKKAAEQLDRKYVVNLLRDSNCTITDIFPIRRCNRSVCTKSEK